MLAVVIPRTIICLEMFVEGENKIPWTIMLGINSKTNPLFFEIYKIDYQILREHLYLYLTHFPTLIGWYSTVRALILKITGTNSSSHALWEKMRKKMKINCTYKLGTRTLKFLKIQGLSSLALPVSSPWITTSVFSLSKPDSVLNQYTRQKITPLTIFLTSFLKCYFRFRLESFISAYIFQGKALGSSDKIEYVPNYLHTVGRSAPVN